MAFTEVLVKDPCHVDFQEMLTVAHIVKVA